MDEILSGLEDRPRLTLEVGELLRRGVLAPGSRTRGVIRWTGSSEEVVASISTHKH